MRKIVDVMDAMINADEIISETRKEYYEAKRKAKRPNRLLNFIRHFINK